MNLRSLIIVSLVLNTCLLGALVLRKPSVGATAVDSAETQTSTVSKGKFRPTRNRASQPDLISITNTVLANFTWHEVESGDYKEYIANLRKFGCPEKTVRDIIISDIEKLYAGKFLALRDPTWETRAKQYWRPVHWEAPDREQAKQYRALEKEKEALIKELLGDASLKARRSELGWPDYMEEQFGFLSEDKRRKAQEVATDFQDERSAIYQNCCDEDDQIELRKIQKRQMAELAKHLTPEEIEQWELRTSDIANNLRSSLTTLSPNEAEFKAIFQAKKLREDLEPAGEGENSSELRKKLAAAEKESDETLKKVLGEDRFKEYKRSEDWAYRGLIEMSSALGFGKEQALAVYEMRDVVNEQANQVRNNKDLTPEQKQAALMALREETEKAMVEQIGETGLKQYRRQGGHWMHNLGPRKKTK